MKKLQGAIFIALLFILGACTNNVGVETNMNATIKIINNDRNIGEIPMDEGKLEIPFEFVNTGTEAIVLLNAETSCMCTEGILTDIGGGDKSAIIKMAGHGAANILKKVIKPNETLLLTAIYDPNAHGPDATGPVSRNIYIQTSTSETLDFRFIGNVVKTRTNTGAQSNETTGEVKELFSFDEESFDFGTIKQSGGKVQHDFIFTYNGEAPINITGVPTSCACTSAKVDKTELQKGDVGTLTVIFNPNLHAEPQGRFFKTVNILTDTTLEEIPEIKIWTEIDLDLGEEAFELKTAHNDDAVENTDQVKIGNL